MVDWFKRYGIPGGMFYCAVIIWGCFFWKTGLPAPDSIYKIGIVAFVPLGYGLDIIGRLLYHCRRDGVHRQAVAHLIEIFPDDETSIRNLVVFLPRKFYNLSENEFAAWSPVIGGICSSIEYDDSKSALKKPLNLEEETSGWIRRRMDILAMNDLIIHSLWLSPIVSFLVAIFTNRLQDKNIIFNDYRFNILAVISVLCFCLCRIIKPILERQISRVIAAVLKCRYDIIYENIPNFEFKYYADFGSRHFAFNDYIAILFDIIISVILTAILIFGYFLLYLIN